MKSRRKTIGRKGFRNSNKNCWTPITDIRAGIMMEIPTKESLQALDLGYVAEDLEQRGILKNG